ncbi:MAG TPA: hypothetical protein VF627_05375 [Abditibacterium sp.]|jgi:hypothetical protein
MSKIEKLDWRIERLFRAVALFDQLHVLEEAIQRFKKHNWTVHEFDCRSYSSTEEFLNAILQAMGIVRPGHVYKNIKMIQFWDLLRYVEMPEENGLALAFNYLNEFRPEYPEFFQELLSSIAREHHYQLKRGLRFMACAHLTDRDIKFETLYIIKAEWNEQPSFSEEADKKVEKLTNYIKEMAEARSWLQENSGFNSKHQKFNFEKALLYITGAINRDALIEMDLRSPDMIRLLQRLDLNDFAK